MLISRTWSVVYQGRGVLVEEGGSLLTSDFIVKWGEEEWGVRGVSE